ncbi:MAG: DUF1294 domain-containing protein [Clostridia bacterium]|nr:DUF1294 domain-containing protein [Clostridia bacterium]
MSNYEIILLVWNVFVMLVYGFDKLRAKRGGRRVREASLLLCAFLFGGVGAMFGMVLFNHKTSKMKFRLLVPLAVVVSILTVSWLFIYLSLY